MQRIQVLTRDTRNISSPKLDAVVGEMGTLALIVVF